MIELEEERRNKGAIFWIVIKIIAWGHIIPSITWGNQKCIGAAPNFNNKASLREIEKTVNEKRSRDLEKIIIEDPSAWIKKYFKAASEENLFFSEIIKGMNEIRFNSRPAQAENQKELETARIEPSIKVKIKNILKKE